MKVTQRGIVVLLVALFVITCVLAQESPTIFVDKFDTSKNLRTNVCEQQKQIWNGSLALPDALRGLNLNVVIANYQRGNAEDEFFTLVDGKIREGYPGLYAVILDEVSRRAGFQWRNSFGTFSPLDMKEDVNKTWTDILLWGIEVYDISIEAWGNSVARKAMGVSFPAGFYDSSAAFAELLQSDQTRKVINLWAFLNPFRMDVWGCILGIVLLTGLTSWCIENLLLEPQDEESLHQQPIVCIFNAAMVFTGHFGLRCNNHASRILAFSWTFWTLIVVSGYTANLASYLVTKEVKVFRINSVQDALKKNASICVQAGAVVDSVLSARYPQLNLIGKESEAEIFSSLRLPSNEGGCDAAAHQLNSVHVFLRDKGINHDCAIATEDKIAAKIPAGMATSVDTGRFRCTSLISAVLDYYLLQMTDDGFIEEAWYRHLNRIGTIQCDDDAKKKEEASSISFAVDEEFSLSLGDVGGIFILHFMLSSTAIILALFSYLYNPNQRRTLQEVFGIAQARYAVEQQARQWRESRRNIFVPNS
jgi:Ligand-gated ion channel